MLKRPRRGMVLITTMLTLVIVIMLVSSVVHSNIGNLRLGAAFSVREMALMAAQSGVQYAVTRLQSDPFWVGDPDENELFKMEGKIPGLTVSESKGNIYGRVETSNGHVSFFRIKFNYEDDLSSSAEDGEALARGLDAIKNSDNPIPSPFVSVNNLYSNSATTVYLARPDGTLEVEKVKQKHGSGSLAVPESLRKDAYELPASTCALIVEGFAGNSLRGFTIEDFVKLQNEKNSPLAGSAQIYQTSDLARRIVEVYLKANYEEDSIDAVAYAAGDLASISEELTTEAANGAGSANIYARNDIDIFSNKINMGNNKLRYGGLINVEGLNSTAAPDYNGSKLTTLSDDDIRAVSWEEVKKAKYDDKHTLDAGYYVFKRIYKHKEDGNYAWKDGRTELFYYPTYEAYMDNKDRCIEGGPESNLTYKSNYKVSYDSDSGPMGHWFFFKHRDWRKGGREQLRTLAGGRVVVDLENASLSINGDVNIVSKDGESTDFVVTFEQGQVKGATVPRPMLAFTTPNEKDPDPIVTFDSEKYGGTGNINIQGG